MDNVIHEITPLMDKDVLYIADRHKKKFTYPIHDHDVMELNFVQNASGVRRIVGDNSEVIGDYDLVLITSPNLEHVWEQADCHSTDIREVTVQFDFGTDVDTLFSKTPLQSIRDLLIAARKGVVFPMEAIMLVYDRLDHLSEIKDGFQSLLTFLGILKTLSVTPGYRTLASTSFAKVNVEDDSRRILKVKNYITQNFDGELKLERLADLAHMSRSAFSRFFKMHTGRTLTDYIADIRLGHATRMLIDTNESVAEISYKCGFNNLSNFNRIFKRRKGCAPSEFRSNYHKVRVII